MFRLGLWLGFAGGISHRLGRGGAQVALHVPREEGEARVGRRLLDLVRVRVRVRVRVKVRVRVRRLLDLVGLADDNVEESSRVVARVLTGKDAG